MPDWNRPKRVRNMRRVMRQGGQKPPKGCEFWVLYWGFLVVAGGLIGGCIAHVFNTRLRP